MRALNTPLLISALTLLLASLLTASTVQAQASTTDLVDSFVKAWQEHDVERMASLFDADAQYVEVPTGSVYTGPEGVAEYATMTFSGAPDFAIETRTIARAGNVAVWEWMMRGTQTGDWPGLPATGAPFSVPGLSIIEMDGMHIQRAADYWDLYTLLQQLGVHAPPQASTAPATAQAIDPVPVQITSAGAIMQGRFFRASCEAPCPTLLLVPGQPGGTQDVLGLGSRLSPHGLNVLMFNPRGHHESEGTFTFFNTLDDIRAAFEWLHDASVVERFRVDTASVAIGGYSFGGGMSLAYAARDPRVRAVFSAAGTDHAEIIREYQRNPSLAEFLDEILRERQAPDGPVRFDIEASKRELLENQNVFGLRENAGRLADRKILLLGGWDDRNVSIDHHLLPLYRALREAGAEDVTFLAYHDDHGFGQSRERLADDVRRWVLNGPRSDK